MHSVIPLVLPRGHQRDLKHHQGYQLQLYRDVQECAPQLPPNAVGPAHCVCVRIILTIAQILYTHTHTHTHTYTPRQEIVPEEVLHVAIHIAGCRSSLCMSSPHQRTISANLEEGRTIRCLDKVSMSPGHQWPAGGARAQSPQQTPR
jgi:hypothetical protein